MPIDLNADVGESFGVYRLGNDEAIIGSVTSVNIACGFHAGDPGVMRRTARLAIQADASIGAHPGFPDLQGFGRRELNVSPQDVEDLVLYQVAALAGIVGGEGARLHHVKAHGALYHMAARDPKLAAAVVAAVRTFDDSLVIVAPPRSQLIAAATAQGMRTAAEAFADRAYRPDGSLLPRESSEAMVSDPSAVRERVLRLARSGEVVAIDGSVVAMPADTICVHGDTPHAASLAAMIRGALAEAGITCAPLT
jgi:5-oxoprolinase (ATP-hydrolysing) subunit A